MCKMTILCRLLFVPCRVRRVRALTLQRTRAPRVCFPLAVLLPCPAHSTFPSR